MMKHSFYPGQDNIQSIWTAKGEMLSEVGRDGVDKIVVVFQAGQMSVVPWFCIMSNGQEQAMVNAAMVEGVLFTSPAKGDSDE